MRVRITEKGVSVANEPVPVGAVIEVKGDTVPAWLINKAVPAETFIVNPAKKLTKKEQDAKDKADAAERATVVESAALLGVEVTDEMTVEEIKAAIDNAGK